MPLRMGLFKAHFNSYHHNTSLLFQFILSEFILSYREAKVIHRYMLTLKSDGKEISSPDLDELRASINNLAGLTKEYMRIFSWNIDNGILAKLKNYCALLVQYADPADNSVIALHRYADKVWLLCLQNIDILHLLNSETSLLPAKKLEKVTLSLALKKMSLCFRHLARLIPLIIKQFKDDENVVFFLLNNKEALDELYGKGFFQKLCKKMYPLGGIAELGQLLEQKYFIRGFTNLIPKIKAKIAELETVLA
jgi:hypothetical protein